MYRCEKDVKKNWRKLRSDLYFSPHATEVKVKLSLYVPWRHIGGLDVWLHSFLTSTLGADEWLTSCPILFMARKNPRTV
jgi:hypothetical protein